MTLDRTLVARYFRQMAELGVSEIFLDTVNAHDALNALSGRAPLPGLAMTEPAAPAAAAAAAMAAPGVGGLAALAGTAASCVLCGLHATRSSVVFGEGNENADVVVVGEAPGQEEDRTGRPFVGRAGQLLDLMLASVGLPRQEVYICNVLKCRPPQNRNPAADEVSACTKAHLFGQLDAIAPRVVLAVGKFAAQALLETDENISRLRGSVHSYRGKPLVVTYHPAFLLRSPHMTRAAWQDLQLLRRVLDE